MALVDEPAQQRQRGSIHRAVVTDFFRFAAQQHGGIYFAFLPGPAFKGCSAVRMAMLAALPV